MSGAGQDDLFWHWDAFQAHYRTLADTDRAAVLQGFRQLQADGRIALFDPPEGDWITTQSTADVLARLDALPPSDPGDLGNRAAEVCTAALQGGSGVAASAVFWAQNNEPILSLPAPQGDPILAALRHIYEKHDTWDPFPGRVFELDAVDLVTALPPMTHR